MVEQQKAEQQRCLPLLHYIASNSAEIGRCWRARRTPSQSHRLFSKG